MRIYIYVIFASFLLHLCHLSISEFLPLPPSSQPFPSPNCVLTS